MTTEPPADSSAASPGGPPRRSVLLVTGMSGAGKSTALRELEDLGWEAIDNFPIRLLDRLLAETDEAGPRSHAGPLAVGFDSRTRGFVPADIIAQVKALVDRADLEVSTLFLDCSDAELERRFNENRRRHPLADDRPLVVGIGAERELVAPLKRWADLKIDTSGLSSNGLQEAIRERFGDETADDLTVTVSSFGFARGMPPVADLVFDMRYLDNPHWQSDLREMTGLDAPVGEYIESKTSFPETFARMRDLVIDLLPRYRAQGKSYVTVAFGCTGGRHRSVYSAEKLGAALREAGYAPTLLHRNLSARANPLVEGGRA